MAKWHKKNKKYYNENQNPLDWIQNFNIAVHIKYYYPARIPFYFYNIYARLKKMWTSCVFVSPRKRTSEDDGLSRHQLGLLQQTEGVRRRRPARRLHRWLHRPVGQKQKAAQPHHVQHLPAGGAGEGVPEDTLPRRLRQGAAGLKDRAHRGSRSGASIGDMTVCPPMLTSLLKIDCILFRFLKGLVPESQSQMAKAGALREDPRCTEPFCYLRYLSSPSAWHIPGGSLANMSKDKFYLLFYKNFYFIFFTFNVDTNWGANLNTFTL